MKLVLRMAVVSFNTIVLFLKSLISLRYQTNITPTHSRVQHRGKKMRMGFCCMFIMIIISQSAYSAQADSLRYIVEFDSGYSPPVSEYRLEKIYDNTYYVDNINYLNDLEEYIDYMERDDVVELIEPSVPKQGFKIYSSFDNNSIPDVWQLEMVNANYAWDMGTFGNDINVAVIDSGCNKHIDLGNNLAGGYNFISSTDDYSDNIGHGTHIAGIIAAEHNDFGIMGASPKVNIYALKCFDSNYQTTVSVLAKAIRSAVDDYDCKVINMSFGLKNDREILHEAVQYAADKGAIIIAAVGNDGDDQIYYPAGYEEVIGVGSVGRKKEISYFSQVNHSVFIVAPGEEYESLKGESDYTIKQGTSQAAPIVTAAAAILLSADDDISPQRFKELITDCSEDLGTDGYDTEYGHGLLNIQGMFNATMSDYYVSPINANGVIVYNNTNDELFATGIWSEYVEDEYSGGRINEIFVPPKEKVNIPIWESENNLKFFLWKSMSSMVPLTKFRNGEVNK